MWLPEQVWCGRTLRGKKGENLNSLFAGYLPGFLFLWVFIPLASSRLRTMSRSFVVNVFKCWLWSMKEKHSCTDGSCDLVTVSQSAKLVLRQSQAPKFMAPMSSSHKQPVWTQDMELLRVRTDIFPEVPGGAQNWIKQFKRLGISYGLLHQICCPRKSIFFRLLFMSLEVLKLM